MRRTCAFLFSLVLLLALIGCGGSTSSSSGGGTGGTGGAGGTGGTGSTPSTQFFAVGLANGIGVLRASATGATLVTSLPTGTSSGEQDVAAIGSFVFSASGPPAGAWTVTSWKFDGATGALTSVANFPTNAFLQALIPDNTGKFIYGDTGQFFVNGWSANAASGALTALAGSPFPTPGTSGLFRGAVSPDGTWICGAGSVGRGVSEIDCVRRDLATGALLTGQGNEVIGGANVPYGRFQWTPSGLLMATAGNQLATFRVTPTGITQLSAFNLPDAGGNSAGFGLNATGTLAIVCSGSTALLLSVDGNGSVAQLATATAPSGSFYAAFSRDGTYAAVLALQSAAVFSVTPTTLTAITGSPVALPASANSMVAVGQ